MPGNDLSAALARTLAALRAERGWSLDQLAARSGVSKGVLVSLEQARSNPNLATLARVGDAFGLPVTRLLDIPPEPSVRITGPGDARTLWHGAAGGTGTIVAATEAPWAAELWRWMVRPGESFGGDPHAPASPGACRIPTPTREPSRCASPWWWSCLRPRRERGRPLAAGMPTARRAGRRAGPSEIQSASLVRRLGVDRVGNRRQRREALRAVQRGAAVAA